MFKTNFHNAIKVGEFFAENHTSVTYNRTDDMIVQQCVFYQFMFATLSVTPGESEGTLRFHIPTNEKHHSKTLAERMNIVAQAYELDIMIKRQMGNILILPSNERSFTVNVPWS